MRLLSLSVENFRGVRKAAIEFGPGLNVLHGPNDLGKSSLATAIRAALLLQASAKEHEAFINLQGTGVRVSNIEPGLCESEFSLVRFAGDQARYDATYAGAEPIQPQDIAETIFWRSGA